MLLRPSSRISLFFWVFWPSRGRRAGWNRGKLQRITCGKPSLLALLFGELILHGALNFAMMLWAWETPNGRCWRSHVSGLNLSLSPGALVPFVQRFLLEWQGWYGIGLRTSHFRLFCWRGLGLASIEYGFGKICALRTKFFSLDQDQTYHHILCYYVYDYTSSGISRLF